MSKRPYALKKRAENQEETRERIVAAAAALHEELGPRLASISAIAEKAGVQRLTVYRHFPDETALFAACTGHWLARHPLPDPARWQDSGGGGADDGERVLTALTALYSYYRGTRRMWVMSHRDVEAVPAMQGPMQAVAEWQRDYAGRLARGPYRTTAAQATLQHAVQFATWMSLDTLGLDDGEMADLVLGWLRGSAGAAPA